MAFSLASIQNTHRQSPPRMLVQGVPGIGKSTFGSELPNPVFIQAEDGLDGIDAAAFPLVKSYEEVVDQLGVIHNEDNPFKAVVIDTVDALERLIWKKVADDNQVESIESIGYGRGYVFALNYWQQLLGMLNALRNKGYMICLLCHTTVKKFQSPVVDSYDRYELALHKHATALLIEWCDIVGFANYQVFTKNEDAGFNKTVKKAVGQGVRRLHLSERPAFIAKNRYRLPDEIDFSWAALEAALQATPEQTTEQ